MVSLSGDVSGYSKDVLSCLRYHILKWCSFLGRDSHKDLKLGHNLIPTALASARMAWSSAIIGVADISPESVMMYNDWREAITNALRAAVVESISRDTI